ncbi:MAG TPA: hypothetical protein VD998_00745 [Verrucomicrobiae bacterium]|nr:hypothetical protein [Verrucomicrobiae bacterium]
MTVDYVVATVIVLTNTALIVWAVRKLSLDRVENTRRIAEYLNERMNFLRDSLDRSFTHTIYSTPFDPGKCEISVRQFEVGGYGGAFPPYYVEAGYRIVHIATGRYYGQVISVRERKPYVSDESENTERQDE